MSDTPQSRYDEKYRYQMNIRLNKKFDGDIIDWLKKQENVSQKIKSYIRSEIEKENSQE